MISLFWQWVGARNIFVISCGVLLFGITTTSLFSTAASTPQQDHQWIDVGETKDGKAILQLDKKSIQLINADTLDKSLVGAQVRFIPKKQPVAPEDQEMFASDMVAVTNAQACKSGQGKLLIGPINKANEALHQDWNRDTRSMLDIIGISLCTMAQEQVRENNDRQRFSKQA